MTHSNRLRRLGAPAPSLEEIRRRAAEPADLSSLSAAELELLLQQLLAGEPGRAAQPVGGEALAALPDEALDALGDLLTAGATAPEIAKRVDALSLSPKDRAGVLAIMSRAFDTRLPFSHGSHGKPAVAKQGCACGPCKRWREAGGAE